MRRHLQRTVMAEPPGVFNSRGLNLIASRKDERLQATRRGGGVDVPSCALPWGNRWISTRGGGWGGEEDLACMEEQALHRSGDGLGA